MSEKRIRHSYEFMLYFVYHLLYISYDHPAHLLSGVFLCLLGLIHKKRRCKRVFLSIG